MMKKFYLVNVVKIQLKIDVYFQFKSEFFIFSKICCYFPSTTKIVRSSF